MKLLQLLRLLLLLHASASVPITITVDGTARTYVPVGDEGSNESEEAAIKLFCATVGLAHDDCAVFRNHAWLAAGRTCRGVTVTTPAADEAAPHVWAFGKGSDAVTPTTTDYSASRGRLAVQLPATYCNLIAPLDTAPTVLLGEDADDALLAAVSEYQLLHFVNAVSELDDYLRNLGVDMKNMEGRTSTHLEKLRVMRRIALNPGVDTVCEVGFNGGHSALLFLSAGARRVISFELGLGVQGTYSSHAVSWLSERYPGRLQVILGDSLKTVPNFATMWPAEQCNVIFVDGGHLYHQARADLLNLQAMRNASFHVIIMDDTNQAECKLAWDELISGGIVEEIESVSSEYSEFLEFRHFPAKLSGREGQGIREWDSSFSIGRYLCE